MREHSKENIRLGKIVFYACVVISLFAVTFCRGQESYKNLFNSSKVISAASFSKSKQDTTEYVAFNFKCKADCDTIKISVYDYSLGKISVYKTTKNTVLLLRYNKQYNVSVFKIGSFVEDVFIDTNGPKTSNVCVLPEITLSDKKFFSSRPALAYISAENGWGIFTN